MMEGNRGGGKSELLLLDYAKDVGKGYGENWRGILFRKQLGDLDEMVRKAESLFDRLFDNFRFLHSKADYAAVWTTGERLLFRHLMDETEYEEYHGHQYPWIGFEELTQWENDKAYKSIFSCCRPPAQGVPTRVRANTNPCVDEGDVMTPQGWRDIRGMKVGDPVFSFSKGGVLRESKVSAVYESQFDGEMVRREGRGLYMSFTPNHRLPKTLGNRQNSNGKVPGNHLFTLTPFNELPGQAFIMRATKGWEGTVLSSFSVPLQPTRKRKTEPVLELSGLDYAELMGWYLSEGCVIDRDRAFQIAQSKAQHRPTIKRLLDRCGFKQSWSDQSVVVYSADWHAYLQQFGECREKFVPREVLNSSSDTLRAFFDAAVSGDGHRESEHSGQYYTTSKQLADDVAEVAVKLGYTVYVSSRQRENRSGLSYAVSFAPGRNVMLATGQHRYEVSTNSKPNVERVRYSGPVYCIGVDGDETFVIRQRGTVWLSGNSGPGHNWVKKRFKLPKMSGRIVRTRDLEDRVAIRSDLNENFPLLHSDPGYPNRIRAAARSPAEAEAWAYGNWDVTFGGMFDDIWDKSIHVIPDISPSSLPRGWVLSRAYDHGQSKPFSVGWFAESNGEPIRTPIKNPEGKVTGYRHIGSIRGDLVLFKEWYGCALDPENGERVDDTGLRMRATQIAEGIRDREKDWGVRHRVNAGPADTEIWSKDSRGTQLAPVDDFETVLGSDCFEKADKSPGSRIRGWQKIREFLEGARPGADGTREKAGLFVCEGCTNWIDLVPILPRSTDNQDEIPDKIEDHAGDMTRYRTTWSHSFMSQGRF